MVMRFYCYLFLVIVLFFYFNGGVPAFRDGAHFYHPLFLYLCDEVMLGRLPFWNPYENLGQPLAANPTSLCFYPITIIAIFVTIIGVDRDLAYSLSVAFHILLAAVTCYRFIRANRMSHNAAIFAGLSYSLGGAVIFQWNNLPFLISAAWLPEALRQAKIIFDKSLINQNNQPTPETKNEFSYKKSINIRTNIIAFAITLAMIILGGDPQMAYNIIICVGIIILFSFKYRIKTFFYFLLAGLFAFMFAAIQILPATEFWQLSDRVLAQHNASIDRFAFHPLRVLEFIFTGIGGKLFPIYTGINSALLNDKNFWTPSTYIGLLPATFAFCAVVATLTTFNRRRIITQNRYKFILAFFVIFIIFLLGSFGNDFLIYRLMRNLPAYNSFRYPSKLLTIVTLAISFFAAVGFDTFRLNKRFAKFTVITTRIIVTIFFVLTIFISCQNFADFPNHPLFGSFDNNIAKNNLIKSVIIVTIIWLLLECIYRYNFIPRVNKPKCFRRIISGWCLVIILTFDLFIANSWLMISLPFGHSRMNLSVLDLIEADKRLNVDKIQLDKNNKLDHVNNFSTQNSIVPIRVYRSQSLRYPSQFKEQSSRNRFEEIINWEKLTLYPRYLLPARFGMLEVRGTMMHKDYYWAMAQIAADNTAAENGQKTGLLERHLEQLGVSYIIANNDSFATNLNFNANKIIIDPKNIDSAKLKFLDEISIWRLRKPLLREYIVYEPNRIV
ncbi:MAG: hypothetical protein LBH59_00625, partial [Planctomycetaceae bacterium]|nr:hypothetical protein [Planctomycetaceae bacterium]